MKKTPDDKEKKKRIEEISKMIHPHDDEPDPTSDMGNYNFPQMLFAFCLGFVTMFILSVKEIEKGKPKGMSVVRDQGCLHCTSLRI